MSEQPGSLLAFEQEAARLVGAAPDVASAVRVGLGCACRHLGWPLGHVCVVHPHAEGAVDSGIWHPERPHAWHAFVEASRRAAFFPGSGIVGRVLATGEAVVLPDVEQEPFFLRRTGARRAGVCSMVAVALRTRGSEEWPGGTPAGVLELFHPERRRLGCAALDSLERVARLLGARIERAGADELGALGGAMHGEASLPRSDAAGVVAAGPVLRAPSDPPAVAARHRDGAGQHPRAASGGVLRILVAEDHEDAAFALAEYLRRHGCEVRLARDGLEVLAQVEASLPDVVVLDIGLPALDGWQVARHLRAAHPSGRPGLVALSGYGEPRDRERSRAAGIDRHLRKPVEPAHLLAVLREVAAWVRATAP